MKPLDHMTTEEIDDEYDRLMASLPRGLYVDFNSPDDGVQLDGWFTVEQLRAVARVVELVAEVRRRGA